MSFRHVYDIIVTYTLKLYLPTHTSHTDFTQQNDDGHDYCEGHLSGDGRW